MGASRADAEPGISAGIVAIVSRALNELGLHAPPVIGEVVESSVANALFDDAARALKSETVGIEVAQRVPIGGLGMIDYGLCASKTLGEGLRRTARYYGVATQRVKLTLLEEGPTATLHFERRPGLAFSRQWIEWSFAMFAERIRQTLGVPVAFRDVSFTHAAPASAAGHVKYFGGPVAFGAARDAMSFDATLLGLPLKTASESLADVLELKMQSLEPEQGADELMRRARSAVLSLLDRQDTALDSLAARLGTSRRTLQRELGRRGTSHLQLVDEARRSRARELLESGISIANVSDRLAFSEPSAFFRAFRRWTGQTPKAALGRAGASPRAGR